MPKNTAAMMAFEDISKYLEETTKNYNQEKKYLVTPYYLYTKEARRLNRELGVSKLNYFDNTNGSKE